MPTTGNNLDKALHAATAGGWTVVDMKNDWKEIFSPQGLAKEAKP